jgi:hypothetical protein
MRRLGSRRQLGALVGSVVLVGAGGWLAGTQVRSPADAAAAHRAPKAGPVTVGVERRSLTATVVATGSVEFASPRPLSLAGPVGTGSSGGANGEGVEQRVTKAPVAGTKVKEGDVLMTVNGRPVLALSGSAPMYRALGPGASGDDVTQLQKALRRIGFDPGSISGTYRQGTAAAVTDWYTSKGYDAQQPSAADQQQLGQLQQAVSAAQETLLTTDADGPAGHGTAGTDTGHETDASTSVEHSTSTPGPDSGTGSNSAAGTGTDAQVRKIQIKSAHKSLDMANAALSTFQDSYGTKIPAGEVVFFPKLPVRLDKVTVKTGDAPSGQIGTVTSSDLVVQTVVPGSDAKLLRHGMAVEVTTADGSKAAGTVDAIGAEAASATATDNAEGSAGTGSGSTDAASAGAGSTGAEAPGGSGAGASGSNLAAPVQMLISLPDPGPLAGQADASVKVTIEVGASDGKVLTVPLAAIRTSSDGQARVQVRRGGAVSDVQVTVGLSAAGLVEVKPTAETLNQGDEVVVGE